MKYTRKDNKTNKILFLFVIAIGIGIIYLGLFKFYWTWNLLTLPIGLVTMISGYKNYKRANFKIQALEFKDDRLHIRFLNGKEIEIKNKNLSYSLLVKKYYKPIRSIELIEKRKIGFLRGKSIGIIEFAKWENDIEKIGIYLIRNGFDRKKWKFSWSIGDFLLIFSILLGFTEGVAETFIKGLDMNYSEPIGELGEIISDENERSIEESIESEERYLRRNRD